MGEQRKLLRMQRPHVLRAAFDCNERKADQNSEGETWKSAHLAASPGDESPMTPLKDNPLRCGKSAAPGRRIAAST
jgi:hypothetical protein